MLLDFIFILLSAAVISEILPKNRTSWLWTLLLLLLVAYSGSYLFMGNSAILQQIAYPWLQTPNLEINLNINLDVQNLPAVQGLWLMTLIALLGNWGYPGEKSPNSLNGLLLLNLLSTLFLTFAENYVQLLVALGLGDVLVFGMINDFSAKRKYIYANFLADMGILSICSVIMGQSGNMHIGLLSTYFETGHHRDFVAILLLICIFVKSGLFLFQGIYMDMASLLFNRLSVILYMATPLAGYILLNKLSVLLNVSQFTYPILYIFSGLSVLWGAWGFVALDNIRYKAVYLSMMFWGMVYFLTASGHQTALAPFMALLFSAYLFSHTLTLVNLASSNEVYVSEMGGFGRHIPFTFGLSVLLMAAYFCAWGKLEPSSPYAVWTFGAAISVLFAHFCTQVYLGKSNADERVVALLKNPLPLWGIGLMFGAAAVFYIYPQNLLLTVCLGGVFLLCLLLRPLRKLTTLYGKAWLQDNNYLDNFYDLVLNTPIKVVGRVLWLTVDFVFIERTLISFIRNVFNFLIFIVRKLNSNTYFMNILYILFGIAVVCGAWLKGGH